LQAPPARQLMATAPTHFPCVRAMTLTDQTGIPAVRVVLPSTNGRKPPSTSPALYSEHTGRRVRWSTTGAHCERLDAGGGGAPEGEFLWSLFKENLRNGSHQKNFKSDFLS
jgi:hypothetical protein